MKSADLADATTRALDMLPPGDPARSDPKFVRDALLAREARMTRETAADVWLAVSPLRVAPPEVLHGIMDTIRPVDAGKNVGSKLPHPWLAASGWAAAALVALLLWPRKDERKQPQAIHDRSLPSQAPTHPETRDARQPMRSSGTRQRNDIMRLQSKLADLRAARRDGVPQVMSLHAPGSPRLSDADAGQRIQAILTEALRSALEAESGAASDNASLVIERGWPLGGVAVSDGETIIRHRNFPEHSWWELGLYRSDGGEYYDPMQQMIWTPDPEGRGFLGRKTTGEEELAGFHNERRPTDEHPAPRVTPEGFVIDNPELGSVEVVIDQVPPPATGSAQFFVWTDGTGVTQSLPLASIGAVQNTGMSSGTLIATIPNSGGLTSFQLVERPLVPNGGQERIIVESGP